MAGTETIRYLADAFQVVGPVGQGLVDRGTANANAGVLNQQSNYALTNAALNEARVRRAGNQEVAREIASTAGSGVEFSGSAQDVVRQNAANLEMDALAERYKGQIEAAGFQSKARMAKYEGRQALYGGVASAGMKLLSQYRKPASDGLSVS